MDSQDRKAIEDLFGKLDAVEGQAGPRDAEAEAYISDRLARQPGAPYYMAQTIVMQDMALDSAQREIEALRRQVGAQAQPGGGGLLSRLFGGGGQPASPASSAYRAAPAMAPAAAGGAWGGRNAHAQQDAYSQHPQQGHAQQGRGGGFMAGAAQTAMGVAGGVLLGNAIGGMFGGGEAVAAEAAPEEAPADEGGFFDDGGGDE